MEHTVKTLMSVLSTMVAVTRSVSTQWAATAVNVKKATSVVLTGASALTLTSAAVDKLVTQDTVSILWATTTALVTSTTPGTRKDKPSHTQPFYQLQ